MRRSYMSASAPAGIDSSIIGAVCAVATSATILAEWVISVMAQAAPTPWISIPKFDSRLAKKMRRNRVRRSGAPTMSR